MAARVAELTYYPVKECAGIPLTEAEVTRAGLRDDRTYAIVDEEGELRWQWGDPALALITPELSDGELRLRAPGMATVCAGADGSGVDAWLTEVLGKPSRLIRPSAGNGSRLHVVSRASLDLLNEKLLERGAPPLPMNRFRPNIVIDGWTAPHTEDDAHHLTIAGTELTFTERTVRCAITMVDQETGRRDGPEPLRTLADYRRESDGVVFGAYFTVARAGKVSVGDVVDLRGR
jgi:uncharacterized protein YcbX